MLYSPSTRGFYAPEIHAEIPADAVDVPDQVYAALLAGQAGGGQIAPSDDGTPHLVGPAEQPFDVRRDEWRSTASIDRAGFLKALVRANLLPPEQAVAAARGEWPDAFAAALADLPFDPVEAQIDWAAATKVSRMHPLFLALLAFYAGATGLDEQAAEALGDTIFGWTEAEPEAAHPTQPEIEESDQPPAGQGEDPTVETPVPDTGE